MALGEETWRREASWQDTFNQLRSCHDQAYRKIDEALQFDEEGQHNKAVNSYNEGLLLLDKALSLNVECPSSPDFTWEKACSMLDKMRRTRKEILSRMADAQVQRPETSGSAFQHRPEDLAVEPPPSYDEAMANSPSSSTPFNLPSLPQSTPSLTHTPQTYSELGEALRNLKVETGMQCVQVMFKVENVQIYFISPDGSVSAPSEPSQLRILQLEAGPLNALANSDSVVDGKENGLPKFFLQVGDWFYPLVPDVSPCFRSEFGAFILPDLRSSQEGAAVGLMLPPESDISLFNFLEDVLNGIVSRPPTVPPRSRTKRDDISTSISRGIVTGAHYVSTGLIKGAEAASDFVSAKTPKLMSRLTPEEPRPIPPTLRTGAKVARSVTHTAVNVTGYVEEGDKHSKHSHRQMSKLSKVFGKKLALASKPHHHRRHRHRRHGHRRERYDLSPSGTGKVGLATMALGRYLAPHVQRQGTKLLQKAGVGEQAAAEGVGGVLTVAAGAVQGFGTVYTGLEQSAAILGSSLADNTVQIVQHKYGEPMAEVTGNTLYTVGNVINTTNNIQNLTPKGLAKRTAKNAGKALVEPHSVDTSNLDLPSTSQTKK